jgi:ABC-type branched-subunit amino acid transport system substrate-binding protein
LEASLAQQFPQDMRRLHFTSFGNPNEWVGKSPSFFQEWAQTYVSPVPSGVAPQPQYDVMLTYDAVQVLAHATKLVRGSLTGDALRDALAALGHGKIPAYQGISGLIYFDSAGDPIDKAIVVLAVTSQGRSGSNEITLSQILGRFF